MYISVCVCVCVCVCVYVCLCVYIYGFIFELRFFDSIKEVGLSGFRTHDLVLTVHKL